MSYDVLAVDGPVILRLLSRHQEMGAHLLTRDRFLDEHAGDRLVRYEWDGAACVGSRMVSYPLAPIETEDITYCSSTAFKR